MPMLPMFRIPSSSSSTLGAYFEFAVADLGMRESVVFFFCPRVSAFAILKIFVPNLVFSDDYQLLFWSISLKRA